MDSETYLDSQRLKIAVLWILILLSISGASSQQIHLKGATIDDQETQRSLNSHEKNLYQPYKILQFDSPSNRSLRQKLQKSGLKFLDYIPENTWLVSLPENRYGEIRKREDISLLTNYKPKFKNNVDSKGFENGTVRVNLFSAHEEVKNQLKKLGKIEKEISDTSYVLKTSKNNLSELTRIQEIKTVSNVNGEPKRFNIDSRKQIEAEEVQKEPYNLEGDGFTGSVWDGNWSGLHPDLNFTYKGFDKLIIGDKNCKSTRCSIDDHATHVAGTMLGNGTLNQSLRGIAPDAQVVSYKWPRNVAEISYETNHSIEKYDSVVSQNSWGLGILSCRDLGRYGPWPQKYDNITSNETNRVEGLTSFVFSAGNYRSDVYPCTNDYNTTAEPATAKNVITVGAVDGSGDVTSFSSWGPTDDGRIKPDVVANGKAVNSTFPRGNSKYPYGIKSGTSMAAPAVSGAVILLNQKFNETYGEKPKPATVKGVLIQTADDIGIKGPDYKTGWGLVDTKDSIDFIDKSETRGLLETGNVSHEEKDVYQFELDDSSANITLIWSDYPASHGLTDETLVNDLDLVVRNSTGHRFYPWTLNYSTRTQIASRQKEDHTNNVEQVYIPNGSGSFTVEVNGTNVKQPPQDYSLLLDQNTADDEPPKPVIESPENKSYSEVPDFNLTSNENLSTAYFTVNNGEKISMDNNTKKKFFNTSSKLEDGVKQVNFTVNDTALNRNWSSVTFTLDTVAPNLTALHPTRKANISSNFFVNSTWSDSLTGINEHNFTVENSTGKQKKGDLNSSVNIDGLSDGKYNITYNVTDKVGNFNDSIIEITIDTSKPSAKVFKPLENENISGNFSLNATWKDTTTAVNRSVFQLYNDTGVEKNGKLNKTVNSSLLIDGSYEINYTFEDFGDNVLNITRSIKIDNTDPDFNINYPEDEGNISSNLSINYNSTDFTGIKNATYKLYNSSGNVSKSRNISKDFNTTVLKESRYNISFKFFDNAGNSEMKNVTEVTVDNTHPEINTTVYGPDGWVKDQRDVQINCSDSLSGINNASALVNGSAHTSSTSSHPLNLTLTKNGKNKFEFFCHDYAGNNASESNRLKIDSEAPEIKSSDPSNESSDTTKSFELDINFDSEKNESQVNLSSSNITITEGTLENVDWSNSSVEGDVSGLSSGESFKIKGQISDKVNHTAKIFLDYSVESESSSDSSSDDSDGGGGGGGSSGSLGGGGLSQEPEVETVQKGVSVKNVNLDSEPQEVEIDSNDIPVDSIEVSGSGETSIDIKKTENSYSPPENTETYDSLDIKASNSNDLDMNVRFKVNKSWFSEKNTEPETTSLYRRNSSKWQKLNTKLVENKTDVYRFKAEVPGFSIFTIASEKKCQKRTLYGVKDGVCKEYYTCELPKKVEKVESCEMIGSEQVEDTKIQQESTPKAEKSSFIQDYKVPAGVLALVLTLGAALYLYRDEIKGLRYQKVDFDSWPDEYEQLKED